MQVLEALKKLGLTEYEGRVYIKLVEHGQLSAKEASGLTGIPYSKIYTALISLIDKGWVSVKEERPKRYKPIEPSFASDLALKNHTRTLNSASKMINDSLQSLYSEDTAAGRSEIWSIRGHANVLRKLREITSLAHHEIFCLLINLDDCDLLDIHKMIHDAKENGCRVLAFHKKSPEKKANPLLRDFRIWESSHRLIGNGIFLFADSKIIFLGSLDEKAIALWSNDLSLAEIVKNVAAIEKVERYMGTPCIVDGKPPVG